MCNKAVFEVIDEVRARSSDLDEPAATRLRHQLHSSLEPAVFDVVAKVADPAVAGAVLCIDGAGRGFFQQDRILQLEPEMMKSDHSIVRGCDTDDDLRQRILGLVLLSRCIGALSVGVGVARPEELAALSKLGVDAVQGHLLGKPPTDLAAFATSADAIFALT
jgi:EAL domain-containing protein (putative c-di-GMP-specific phosphodiesterase class I)